MTATETPFYVTGGTLRSDAPSYVERQADRDLHAALTRGEFCYVLTSRQMGKSSLMVRTAARLRDEGVQVAILDLTAIGQNLSPEQWYGGLLRRLGRQLNPEGHLEEQLDDCWLEQDRRGPLDRFMTALQELVLPRCTGRIVIFVDEIDAVRSLSFSADEFFAAIRECYNRRTDDVRFERLTFCLLGVATPSDLIRDTRMTPFNIGTRIELTDFTEPEAAPLAAGLGRDKTSEALVKRVLHWTGGHPYLTQRLCQAVAEDESVAGPDGVDAHCEALFLSASAREKDDNLIFVRERLLRNEADLATLLDLYGKVRTGRRVAPDDTNPLIDLLRLSGVTRLTADRLVVRNRIYERVFDRQWGALHMPDAEVRRQRAAYRRGLVRAAAVAGVILLVMTGLVLTAARRTYEAQEARTQSDLNAGRLRLRSGQRERALREAQRALQAEQMAAKARDQALVVARTSAEREREQKVAAVAAKEEADAARRQEVEQRQRAVASAQAERQAAERAHAAETRARSAAARTRHLLYLANMNLAVRDWETLNFGRLRRLLAETQNSPDRGFEWPFLLRLCHLELFTLPGAANPVAYSPDGQRIATGGADNTVRLWDAVTGRTLLTLNGHTQPVGFLTFSANGRRLLTAAWARRPDPQTDDVRREIRVWDANTGRPLLALAASLVVGPYWGQSIAFSRDGQRIASGESGNTVAVWDVATGRRALTLTGHNDRVTDIAFGAGDARIMTVSADKAIRSADKAIRVWDARTGQIVRQLQPPFSKVDFSPDGTRILTRNVQVGGSIGQVWDAATGMQLAELPDIGGRGTAFSPDGQRIATGASGVVRVWDLQSGGQPLVLQGFKLPVRAVAFSPDGARLATGGEDHTLRIWDARTGQQLLILKGHARTVDTIAFSPDGRRIVSGSDDRTVKVWDAIHDTEARTLAEATRPLAYSPDGKYLVTGSPDNVPGRSGAAAKVWDLTAGQVKATLVGHDARLRAIAVSPDGRRIVTGSDDRTARVWDAATGRPIMTIPLQGGAITSVAFSPDGRRIATGSSDGTARVWDAAGAGTRLRADGASDPARLLFDLRGPGYLVWSVAFSPDGRRIATGSNAGIAKVWDAASGRELYTFRGHTQFILRVAYSPDGRRIVSAGGDGARIWDAATGREIRTLRENNLGVTSASYSSDGKRIVTTSYDDTTRIWNAVTGEETLALPGGRPVAFSPDGRHLARQVDDQTVRIWEAGSPAQIAVWMKGGNGGR